VRTNGAPGFPQDMVMIMDEAVAKPETYGLAPGWSGGLAGMMTLVRVLPPDKYEEVMSKIRQGKTGRPAKQPAQHQQHRM
jgi:manganese oxidase